MFKKAAIFASVLLSFLLSATVVLAQQAAFSSVATNMEVSEQTQPGDILTSAANGIVRSKSANDDKILGVVVEFPVVATGQKTDKTVAVLTSGQADVKVSALNGEIKAGDLIASSNRAGVGQKAATSGYVLGRALAGYSDKSKDGLIPVLVQIGQVGSAGAGAAVPTLFASLFSLLAAGLANSQNFPLVLRYIGAGIIGSVTFLIAFFSFIRFVRSGLEAIGRNPLAKGTIFAGMLINAGIVTFLTIAGIGISIAIIVL